MARRSIVTACLTAAPLERGGVGGLGAGAPARPERATPPSRLRQQALPCDRRWPAVLLARRHGVGALSPAHARGCRSLPHNRAALRFTVDPGGRAGRVRWPRHAERVRPSAADQQRPGHARRQDGPDNDYWDHVDFVVAEARRARAVRRAAADLGRQVESAEGGGPGGVHARRTPRHTAPGSAAAIATRRTSSGSSAAIGRSTTTCTGRSSAPWRAASARATGART